MSQAILTSPKTKVDVEAPKKAPRPYFAIFEFTLVLFVGLLLLEPILALAGVADDEVMDIDTLTGWAPMPNRSYTYRTEGYARATINSHGMRDIERSVAKPSNTYRIVVMGCSLTEGNQVPIGETYCQILEKQLNKSGSPIKYEVLNFAVSAYTLGQEYLRLKHLALQFKPDLVIFTARPNSLLFMGPGRSKGFYDARPLFAIYKGRLFEDRNLQKFWLSSGEGKRMQNARWMRYHSRLWKVFSKCNYSLNEYKKTAIRAFNQLSKGKLPTPVLAGPVLDLPDRVQSLNPTQVQAMYYLGKVAGEIISESKAVCDKANCKFVLAYLPSAQSSRDEREAKIFEDYANAHGINFINFNNEFDRLDKKASKKFYIVVHFSREGHKAVASYLETELINQDLLGRKTGAKPVESKDVN